MVKRIVLLFSDAGGGHRSAAQAVDEALHALYDGRVETRLADPLTHYAPWPLSRAPAWYPAQIAYAAPAYGLAYAALDGRRRIRLLCAALWPLLRANAARFLREYPADLYLSVHPAMCQLLRGMGPGRPPFITVVTDLVSTHSLWYSVPTDLCLTPTEAARRVALRHGYPPDRVQVVGLPIAARFTAPPEDRAALRARLGWGVDRPVVLLAGGGEGMGPLFEIASAIARSGLKCELAVVAGRNRSLLARLRATEWPIRMHAHGFVNTMPEFMHAADVLVSKAGPGTICEALAAGLPLILYSRLPGQEAGNPEYVTAAGAGVWAPGLEQVAAALRAWIGPGADPALLRRAAENARRLARPDAAGRIAEIAWELAGAARIGDGS